MSDSALLTDEKRKDLRSSLTPKQEAWLNNFLRNGYLGAEASREAGYKGDAQAMATRGHKNRTHPKIQSLIEDHLRRMAMGEEEAAARMSALARSSIANFIDIGDDGEPRLSLQKAAERGALGQLRDLKIKETTDEDGNTTRTIEIKLHDALKATDKLMRAHGAYREDVEVNINSGPGGNFFEDIDNDLRSNGTS